MFIETMLKYTLILLGLKRFIDSKRIFINPRRIKKMKNKVHWDYLFIYFRTLFNFAIKVAIVITQKGI